MDSDNGNVARILVVENDRVNQRVTKATLEHIGYLVDVVQDGEEALEKVTKSNYDLVFMDCHMPKKDGYEATKEIREMSWASNMIIVALTADVSEENTRKCFEIGMNDFIKKPVHIEDLKDKAKKWLPSFN